MFLTLEFCRNDLKLSKFQEETISLIHSINLLFDFLNSRNLCGQGYKSERMNTRWPRIEQILNYILTLKNETGELLFQTQCKIGFLEIH